MVGYYKRFVEGFLQIVMALSRLTQKAAMFEWTDQCEKAFKNLKNYLMTTLILIIPSETDCFQIYNDTLLRGLRCLLMQNERAIAHASRQLKNHEKNYLTQSSNLVLTSPNLIHTKNVERRPTLVTNSEGQMS